MEWLMTAVAGLMLAMLLAPVAMLLLTFFVLVPLAHLVPAPRTVARATFDCPLSKRTVRATFETAGDRERPTDVLACSMFGSGPVLCKKGCLALAAVGWTPSPMVARYSLLPDGTVLR